VKKRGHLHFRKSRSLSEGPTLHEWRTKWSKEGKKLYSGFATSEAALPFTKNDCYGPALGLWRCGTISKRELGVGEPLKGERTDEGGTFMKRKAAQLQKGSEKQDPSQNFLERGVQHICQQKNANALVEGEKAAMAWKFFELPIWGNQSQLQGSFLKSEHRGNSLIQERRGKQRDSKAGGVEVLLANSAGYPGDRRAFLLKKKEVAGGAGGFGADKRSPENYNKLIFFRKAAY